MFWASYLLAMDPEEQVSVRKEIAAFSAGADQRPRRSPELAAIAECARNVKSSSGQLRLKLRRFRGWRVDIVEDFAVAALLDLVLGAVDLIFAIASPNWRLIGENPSFVRPSETGSQKSRNICVFRPLHRHAIVWTDVRLAPTRKNRFIPAP